MMYIKLYQEKHIERVSLQPFEDSIEVQDNEELLKFPNKFVFVNNQLVKKPYITAEKSENNINLRIFQNDQIYMFNGTLKFRIHKYQTGIFWPISEIDVNFSNGFGVFDISSLDNGVYEITLDDKEFYFDSYIIEKQS